MQGPLTRTVVLRSLLGVIGAAVLRVNSTASPGCAEEAKGKGYLPGLGDLMNNSMPLHHTKRWCAGHADNWPLAAYKLKEITESIEDIQTLSPAWHGVPVGAMVKSLEPNLNAPDQAITAKNPVTFDAAYHELTASCNACPAVANQPEIIIIAPVPQSGGTFADQDVTVVSGPQ